MSKVDVGNFMGVLGATTQTEDGLVFDGAHMPNGLPVTAAGVTKAQLMTDKSIAEQWHGAIKAAYESQKEQINHTSSTRDTPELVIRGEDGGPEDSVRSEAPAPVHQATIEEELQARTARWTAVLTRVESRLADLEVEYREAKAQLVKCEAALDAIRDV